MHSLCATFAPFVVTTITSQSSPITALLRRRAALLLLVARHCFLPALSGLAKRAHAGSRLSGARPALLFLYRPRARRTRVRIATVFEKRFCVRDMILEDEITARVFCEFLNKHSGKTMKDIGELDVTFLA